MVGLESESYVRTHAQLARCLHTGPLTAQDPLLTRVCCRCRHILNVHCCRHWCSVLARGKRADGCCSLHYALPAQRLSRQRDITPRAQEPHLAFAALGRLCLRVFPPFDALAPGTGAVVNTRGGGSPKEMGGRVSMAGPATARAALVIWEDNSSVCSCSVDDWASYAGSDCNDSPSVAMASRAGAELLSAGNC